MYVEKLYSIELPLLSLRLEEGDSYVKSPIEL